MTWANKIKHTWKSSNDSIKNVRKLRHFVCDLKCSMGPYLGPTTRLCWRRILHSFELSNAAQIKALRHFWKPVRRFFWNWSKICPQTAWVRIVPQSDTSVEFGRTFSRNFFWRFRKKTFQSNHNQRHAVFPSWCQDSLFFFVLNHALKLHFVASDT